MINQESPSSSGDLRTNWGRGAAEAWPLHSWPGGDNKYYDDDYYEDGHYYYDYYDNKYYDDHYYDDDHYYYDYCYDDKYRDTDDDELFFKDVLQDEKHTSTIYKAYNEDENVCN